MNKLLAILLFTCSTAFSDPVVPSRGPKDKPQSLDEAQFAAFDRAIAPYVAKARSTYPVVKKRFLAGLPRGYEFFVTTRLHDKRGKWEQSFVSVLTIKGGKITGVITTRPKLVVGFKSGDRYTFPESQVLDWTIMRPDGVEEGNFVGKFLDTYHP